MKKERILIVGLKWIGDAIMSMPALQACRAVNPEAHITVLVPAYLKPLWEMHPVPDAIQILNGTLSTIKKLRQGRYSRALILPNSFRSAFMPFAAGIRPRLGLRGKWRRWLLTKSYSPAGGHQSREYFSFLAPESDPAEFPLPELSIPAQAFQSLEKKFPNTGNYVVLMPGAGRGISKRWPVTHFMRLAGMVLSKTDCAVVLSGGLADIPACDELAATLNGKIFNLAGKTSLKEWAALLYRSALCVANDSGGMHLAAAVGTPVVGIFGITDPGKTAPLGQHCRILQKSTLRCRDIARYSDAAAAALSAITPEEVFQSVVDLLEKKGAAKRPPPGGGSA